LLDAREKVVENLREKVFELLRSSDFEQSLEQLRHLPHGRVINALFQALCSRNDRLRWRAIKAMGTVVTEIAQEDMEAARTVMRRLMWSLNDESGGIGWGAPEAMGEILAQHEGLAGEFAHILVSYTREDGNFLEYEPLQRGLMWGLGRLAQVRPHLLADDVDYIIPYLDSPDATIRGLAAWTSGLLGTQKAQARLKTLIDDGNEISIYLNDNIITRRVSDLAEEALMAINKQSPQADGKND